MRTILLLTLLCLANPALSQIIKIGELNSYKVFPAFLEPYKKGWELALEEINASGGVLGRRLEIVSRDDGGTPGDAVRVAEELIAREKVNLLMGTFASNVGLAVANLAARGKSCSSPPSRSPTRSSGRTATAIRSGCVRPLICRSRC